jgi:hypothetical protein
MKEDAGRLQSCSDSPPKLSKSPSIPQKHLRFVLRP